MLCSIIIATLLYCMVSEVLSFSPPSVTKKAYHKSQKHHILCSSANTDTDDFDPFLQSPHDLGDDDNASKDNEESSSAFGFLSYASEQDTTATVPQTSNDGEFDPLLSPHAYENGADEVPVSNNNDGRNISNRPFVSSSVSSSTFGFDIVKEDDSISVKIESSESVSNTQINMSEDEFDPLLSPHAYANGVDGAPVSMDSTNDIPTTTQDKIGILLIDHGSKRSASNEHIMNVARMYEKRMAVKEQATSSSTTIVRAAHMEIAPPSILDSIRNLIVDDKVSKVICVPYFLSPGKHAMEDVPQLIDEAKSVLGEEGLLNDDGDSILVSHALGTHMEGMLSVVDDLVDLNLKD